MTTTSPPEPTLPAEWSASGYGCRKSEDYWIWDHHATNDMRTVLGGPSQTDQADQCFPSTWATQYAGTACPKDFTAACPPSNPTDLVTCCPTAYNFRCVSEASKQPHGLTFPCISKFDSTKTVQITRTDFIASTITFGEVNLKTDRHLFALGVVYTTPTATTTNSASSTSTSESNSSGSSISAGAAAGIGVGAAAGVILIALVAFFFVYRRRKYNAVPAAPPAPTNNTYPNDPKVMPTNTNPHELHSQSCRELEG